MGLDNPLHIVFLVVILLLVFGAKRLPEIGRSLGTGMREFKQSVTGESNSTGQGHDQQHQTLPPATPQAPAPTPPPAPAQDAFAQRDPASSEKS
jgi:sec-independent protein translocase protein TatA